MTVADTWFASRGSEDIEVLANRMRTWGPAAAWATVLFVLSALPALGGGLHIPFGDKIAHLLLYAVLGSTLAWGWSRAGGRVSHLLLLVLGALYGVTDEWHQLYVPGRVPDPADWLADVVGLVLGYGTTLALLGRTGHTEVDVKEPI